MEGCWRGSRGECSADVGIIVGDLYPSLNILGVDLSPIQPEWVPPNVKFMVDDVESAWLKPLNHYDYIHARHTVMAIKNWPQLMGRVYEYVFSNSPFHLPLLGQNICILGIAS